MIGNAKGAEYTAAATPATQLEKKEFRERQVEEIRETKRRDAKGSRESPNYSSSWFVILRIPLALINLCELRVSFPSVVGSKFENPWAHFRGSHPDHLRPTLHWYGILQSVAPRAGPVAFISPLPKECHHLQRPRTSGYLRAGPSSAPLS